MVGSDGECSYKTEQDVVVVSTSVAITMVGLRRCVRTKSDGECSYKAERDVVVVSTLHRHHHGEVRSDSDWSYTTESDVVFSTSIVITMVVVCTLTIRTATPGITGSSLCLNRQVLSWCSCLKTVLTTLLLSTLCAVFNYSCSHH